MLEGEGSRSQQKEGAQGGPINLVIFAILSLLPRPSPTKPLQNHKKKPLPI